MLTKTARWLTLTIAFRPIQSAAGYARSSLTGGAYLRKARSECRQRRSVAALQLGNNLWKFADPQLPPLRDHILAKRARWAAWLFSIGGDAIMNPRRFATVAPAFCGTVVLAGWIIAWLAGFGLAGTEATRAPPIENRAASLAANAEIADEPQAIAMGNPIIASADVATAVESVTGM